MALFKNIYEFKYKSGVLLSDWSKISVLTSLMW